MEKLNNLKPLISRNEELYISKDAKKENAFASEEKSCRPEKINTVRVTTSQYEMYFLNKRPKFTFAQSKRFLPKHNLPDKENSSLEQAAFWQQVVCCLPWVPEIFLACSGNFRCWPKADTFSAVGRIHERRSREKNLWLGAVLFTVPIDL